MKNLNMNKILKEELLSVIKKKGFVNILLFDTETTGLIKPIKITQIGYILVQLKINKENKLEFKEIIAKEKNYYVDKRIEPKAVYITNIIREEDLSDKNYISEIKKIYLEENKKKKEKKEFSEDSLIVLNKELEEFNKKDILLIEDENSKELEVDFYSGHNLYEYDFKAVLTSTYNISVKPERIIDTLYFNMNARKKNGDRISKTKQGRNLNATTNEIIKSIKDKEYLKEIEELMKERENFHSALLDIKVNLIPMKYQIEKIIETDYEEYEKFENNNERQYKQGDILYLETNMSKNNLLTSKDIINYAKEHKIKDIIIVEKYWSNVVQYQIDFKKNNLNLYLGLNVFNKSDNKRYDIIVNNTKVYRHLMSAVIDYQYVTNEIINDLKKSCNPLIIPTTKMDRPKILTNKEKEAFYLLSSALDNEVLTQQEKDYFINLKEDISLETGIHTSNTKQSYLKKQLENLEEIDFYFYEKLGLSAFPPLTILTELVDKEPENIDGYINALLELINDLFYKGNGNNTLKKVLKTTIFTEKEYKDRIEEEIKVLKSTGNSDYVKYFFLMYKNRLIVENEINTKSNKKVLEKVTKDVFKLAAYGPGRGSAAGSLIAFILGITDTNPLKYDLLFERFINPERVSMPDIDVDIQDKELYYNILSDYYNKNMPKVMDYEKAPFDIYDNWFIEKYIKNKKDFVGKISALAYTTKKTILANIVRLYALPYYVQTAISREFVEDKEVSLYDNVVNSSVADEILNVISEDTLNNLDKFGLKGNKLFANYGLHAAGVLFYPYHSAVMTPTLSNNVTIWDGNFIEDMFLVKMDYLGLATKAAIDEIKKKMHQSKLDEYILKNNEEEMDDADTLTSLAKGMTSMTFQMESQSARRILKKLAPLIFDDIIASNALNRPGPLSSGAVDDYISASIEEKRKKYNFKFYSKEERKNLDLKEFKLIKEEIRKKLSTNFILFEDGKKIIMKKGKNNTLIDNENNIYYQQNRKYYKKTPKNEIIELQNIKEFRIAFSEKQLSDDVIENLMFNENYFESENFKNKIKEIYSNLEYQDDETEFYQIIKENKCKTVEEFNEILLKSDSFFNYLNYEEIMFKKSLLIEELEELEKYKDEKYLFYKKENNIKTNEDFIKLLLSDFLNKIAKEIKVDNITVEYFNKIKNLFDNIEYTGGLPIYKRIVQTLKEDNFDNFFNKILELEKEIKNHPIYSILTKDTYKTIVYQEQIMKISTNMAGYTKGESDNLRKAIAKQKKDMMDLHKKKLIEGLTEYKGILLYLDKYNYLTVKDNNNGTITINNQKKEIETIIKGKIDKQSGDIILLDIDENKKYEKYITDLNKYKVPLYSDITARYLWEKIEKFGAYAFNKSHSASYTILTYETQFYKEHFPLIAYSTLLKYVPEKHKQSLLKEIKDRNIKVELQKISDKLSVNYIYDTQNNSILLPISHVKSLGSKDLFPVIPLVKTYEPKNLEEYILYNEKITKKVVETFGVLNMFREENNTESITQLEWYYFLEKDIEQKEENKKHQPILVKEVLEKSLKSKEIKDLLKDLYKEIEIAENEKDIFELLKNISIINDLYMFQYIKEEFNADEIQGIGGENYTIEYIKLLETITKKIEKLKVTEEYKKLIIKNIKKGDFLFFTKMDFYKKFVNYKKEKIKEIAIIYKQQILKRKNELNLEEELEKLKEKETSYIYDKNKKYKELPKEMQQILFETKLKEGNPFPAEPNYENGSSVNYSDIDKISDREKQDMDTKKYRQMLNISEYINKETFGKKINLAIITDFMPKCNKINKYNEVGVNGKKTMREYFEDIFMAIPEEQRKYINPVWISLYEEIKDEVDTNDFNLLEERIEKVFENLITTDIHHIILAMPKKSPLREKIVSQQYKTFQNQNGNKYIKYRTKKGEIVTNKLVGFMDTLFPYEFIMETYINRIQQLLDLMNIKINYYDFLKEKEKIKNKQKK